MKKFIILLLFILLSITAFAQEGNIKLLALAEAGNISKGAVADLHLEIQQGKERVFLETFPITKATTQISMRFAEQIACEELDEDCSGKDFFFGIQSAKGIIGGPSAGAAAAILTASVLESFPLNDSIAMTGTINSGGMIGAVGGLTYKIEAAAENNIKTVLIPKGTRYSKLENISLDLVKYGSELNLSVVEVGTLSEALHFFNPSFKVKEYNDSIVLSSRYNKIMKEISTDLCDRNKEIITNTTNNDALNYSYIANDLFGKEKYYSAASYCFRSTLVQKQLDYSKQNLARNETKALLANLIKDINQFDEELLKRKITNINDLQTWMAVQERILETKENVLDILPQANKTSIAPLIAYAEERFFSAKSWARFFDGENDGTFVDNNRLKKSCESKISEAEERYSYLNEFSMQIPSIAKDINLAYGLLLNQSYANCLHQASKAKANINLLISLMGVEESRLNETLDLKLELAKKAIVRAQSKNIFPLISYAYYEYAENLKEIDPMNSLLYSEYALELSNLDIYFEKSKQKIQINVKSIQLFLLGFITALIFVYSYQNMKPLQTPLAKRLRGKKR